MNQSEGISVAQAVQMRRSVRAYLPTPVDRELLEELLALASQAPSGVNTQPWKTDVAIGDSLEGLKKLLEATFLSGKPEQCEYQYYPVTWRSPYVDRRRQMLEALFGSTGVVRGDETALQQAIARNFRFYGAPVGLVFSIDRDLAQGSWLDYGMFLQTFMLAAKGVGLDTCAEVSIANYPHEVRSFLGIPE